MIPDLGQDNYLDGVCLWEDVCVQWTAKTTGDTGTCQPGEMHFFKSQELF